MRRSNERGIALVLALFLMSVLSVLGASLMFLSQTETYASMNYRMMSQARYAAESGVQRTAAFLFDGTQYTLPSNVSLNDPLTNYDWTKSPVVCLAGCPNNDPKNPNHWVILSASSTYDSNYPFLAAKTAFEAAAQGSLSVPADDALLNFPTTVNFRAYAVLLSMQVFNSFGTEWVVQTWQITSDGNLGGSQKATVQVQAIAETPKVSASPYAAFATADTCGAMYLHGSVDTGSYDSTPGALAANATPTVAHESGDIGTNGNLHIQGSVDVHGNLYSPKTGVGACASGAVTAETITGNGFTVDCPSGDSSGNDSNPCLIKLPKAITYPAPAFSAWPNPNLTVTIGNGGGSTTTPADFCAAVGLTAPQCVGDSATKTVTIDGAGNDVMLPNIQIDNHYTLVIQGHESGYAGPNTGPQTVNINSFGGNGTLQFNMNKDTLVGGVKTDIGQTVVLKVAGKNPDGTDMATPFTMGDWTVNSDYAWDAATLQIVYPGTGALSMKGNDQAAATVYAPSASFGLTGTADFYGSILAKTVDNGGNPSLYYDRHLGSVFFVPGTAMMGTFTWKRN